MRLKERAQKVRDDRNKDRMWMLISFILLVIYVIVQP